MGHSALGPGYLLQVDAVFGPKAPPFIGGFYAPIWAVEKASVILFGGAVTGKLYLFIVLFFASFLPMCVLRRLSWPAQVFAGALGVLNPWTYDRLVEGQWTVIASCDGLFLWLLVWDWLRQRPTAIRALSLALSTLIVVSFSPHFSGILLVLAVACLIGARSWRSKAELRALALATAASVVALAPGAVLFFTGAHPLGLLDLFGLYGYWGERLGRFPVATAHWWWIPAAGVLVGLSVAGAFIDRRRAWLLAAGYFGIAVSLVLAANWGTTAFGWLAQHVSPLRGYREPEKWSALWLVALVCLGAVAVSAVHRARPIAPPLRAVAVAVAFLAVVVPGATEMHGAGSLLVPLRYPSGWYAASRYLSGAESPGARVLVLPWHLYETLPFAGRRPVENPAPVFFPGHILSSQSDDIPGDSPGVLSPLTAERQLSAPCSLAAVVKRERAQFVVVESAVGAEARSDVTRLISCGMVSEVRSAGVTVLGWPRGG